MRNICKSTLLFTAGVAVLGSANLASAAQSGYAGVISARNPLVYLQLDETSGTTAVDSSATGTHSGTYGTGVTLGTPSASGSLPSFGLNTAVTGVSNATTVTIPGSTTAFDAIGSGDFSIELWFNPTNISSREDLFTFKGGASDFGIHFNSANADRLSLYHNGFLSTPANLVSANTWHHLAVTRSGTSESMYLDGVSIATVTDSASLDTGGASIEVGSNTGALYFTGALDEFAFYNTALTATQVAADYTSGVPEPTALSVIGLSGLALLARRRRSI